jgi:hypothetical protein
MCWIASRYGSCETVLSGEVKRSKRGRVVREEIHAWELVPVLVMVYGVYELDEPDLEFEALPDMIA